jgi:hypothetical protein
MTSKKQSYKAQLFTTAEEKINQLVKDYILEKFRERFSEGYYTARPEPNLAYHMAHCATAYISDADIEWECNCYSDVTRSDDMQLLTRITCKCQKNQRQFSVLYPWANWFEVPEILRELYERSREEDLPEKCDYEAEDRLIP